MTNTSIVLDYTSIDFAVFINTSNWEITLKKKILWDRVLFLLLFLVLKMFLSKVLAIGNTVIIAIDIAFE